MSTTAGARVVDAPAVETTLSYVARLDERPFYYQYEPPPGQPWRNTKGDKRRVAVRDARALGGATTLDREGFVLARLETRAADLWDKRQVEEIYFREVEATVRALTGAARVVAFDHNERSGATGERFGRLSKQPVRFAHNDYTERSGPQRVRDLMGAEAEELLRRRFAVINVWKPIRGPVESAPLAVCEAGSIDPGDLLATDLIYADRKGEVYSLAFGERHRWWYYPHLRADEAMVFKCYDSDPACARFTAHSAFDDPTSPPDAAPRESIEVRTLAFF